MEFLINILLKEQPSDFIRSNRNEIFKIIPELSVCQNFNQNNIWHIYDVFEHTLHVVDGVPNNLILRLAALFHDIGKPFVYEEDQNGIGHFKGHWNKSNEIFCSFAEKYQLDKNIKTIISNLILYHDLNIGTLTEDELEKLVNIFDTDGITMLFQLKKSDLLAQNKDFHYILEDYKKQKTKLLNIKLK